MSVLISFVLILFFNFDFTKGRRIRTWTILFTMMHGIWMIFGVYWWAANKGLCKKQPGFVGHKRVWSNKVGNPMYTISLAVLLICFRFSMVQIPNKVSERFDDLIKGNIPKWVRNKKVTTRKLTQSEKRLTQLYDWE